MVSVVVTDVGLCSMGVGKWMKVSCVRDTLFILLYEGGLAPQGTQA